MYALWLKIFQRISSRGGVCPDYKVENLRPIGYYPNEFLEELRKPNPFLYDVLTEGIVIYDDGFLEEAGQVLEEKEEDGDR